MPAETNLIKTTDLHEALTIDYTNTFGENLNKLKEMLGIVREISLTEGSTFKVYKNAKVTLEDGKVAEGETIPLSKVATEVAETKEVTLEKYRKATSGEAIQKYGTDKAVNITDAALIKQLQKKVRTDLFTAVKAGTGTQTALGKGLQGALASAWGKLQLLFEDDAVTSVAFVNPLDVAEYIANGAVTVQTAFGFSYLEGFVGTVAILTSDVEAGKIYATAPDNLVLAYINASNSDLAKTFNLTSDELGYLGMTHFLEHTNLTEQTLVVSGLKFFAERLDGVVKVDIVKVV